MEDPTEDLFVTNVMYDGQNYRIFEGLWEGNGFYLQRFADIVQAMPATDHYESIRHEVESLLTLSDEIAERRKLHRNTEGAEMPAKVIPTEILTSLSEASQIVVISKDDLQRLKIEKLNLNPYCITSACDASSIQNRLERQPLIQTSDGIIVVAASYLSTAIRNAVIDFANRHRQLDVLRDALSRSYAKLFHKTPLLGGALRAPLMWEMVDGVLISQIMLEVDAGRHLHLIFGLDDFADTDEARLAGKSKTLKSCAKLLKHSVAAAASEARNNVDFKEGMTIFVPCGWGRGYSSALPNLEAEDWRITSINAYNLSTLSMLGDMTPLDVFRLEDHVDEMEGRSVNFMNMGGLLNMFGYARHLDSHLLPHDQFLVENANPDGPLTIMVPDTFLLEPRVSAASEQDVHLATPQGAAVQVHRHTSKSYFDDERRTPLYGSVDDLMLGRLRSVYESEQLDVWLTTSTSSESSKDENFTLWDAFTKWLPNIVPAITAHLSQKRYPSQQWHINFAEYGQASDLANVGDPNTAELATAIDLTVSSERQSLVLDVPQGVLHAFHHVSNAAEKAVIQRLIEGSTRLANVTLDAASVATTAMGDSNAKNLHVFVTRTFLDYVHESVPHKPIHAAAHDNSIARLGMVQRAKEYDGSPSIGGVKACCSLLNQIVDSYWKEIQQTLQSLDREATVTTLLLNLECLRRESSRWNRSSRALLALEGDTDATRISFAKQMFRRSTTSLGSRHLLEMAICECPLKGGAKPGDFEFSQLLSAVHLMFELGGWSDAINAGGMKPHLRVTQFGLVLADRNFYDEVLEPFGHAFASRHVTSEARRYDEQFEERPETGSINDIFEKVFLDAWYDEFRFMPNEAMTVIEGLEDHAIKVKQAVVQLRRSQILAFSESAHRGQAERFIDAFTLRPRESWSKLPAGMSSNEIVPWRFRRKLSAVSRPLIQITMDADPTYLVSPSLVREGFAYIVDRSYSGEFEDAFFSCQKMRSWIGYKRDEYGHRFNSEVKDRFDELGWRTHGEVTLDHLLGMKLDKNYGDIDVFAYDQKSGRVLVVECKDLMFAKTPGEVARQLREFRGLMDNDGKPDRLAKHLTRLECLQANITHLQNKLRIEDAFIECVLMFRNPVPLVYVDNEQLKRVIVCTFEDLSAFDLT